MPIGHFPPFDPLDPDTWKGPRWFARPTAFDCECPHCGRLFTVGYRKADNALWDEASSTLYCQRKEHIGCGRRFLIGLIVWPMRRGKQLKGRPVDQRPTTEQALALRKKAQGVFGPGPRRRTEPLNQVEPEIEEPWETDEIGARDDDNGEDY